MRILVTGAGGLVGGRLAELLARRFDVAAARHVAPPPAGIPEVALDLLSSGSIERALDEARPGAVVHAAALADADRCEREPDLAWTLNVGAVEILARLCSARGIHIVFLSTDLVLRGDVPLAMHDDLADPLMTYGRTKLLGEEVALALAPGSAVVRVALVHGRGHGPRGSASESIAWALREGRRVRLFVDQFRTPVDPESIASGIERIIESGASGRYHLGGPERLSRHELGIRVARVLGLPADLVEPARQADHPLGTARPADASLGSGRARRELGWEPRPLEDGIREGRASPP